MLGTVDVVVGYRRQRLHVDWYSVLPVLLHRGCGHVAACIGRLTMFTGATKIVKPEGQEPDEFEQTVAQELFNLEVCSTLLSCSARTVLQRNRRLRNPWRALFAPSKLSCVISTQEFQVSSGGFLDRLAIFAYLSPQIALMMR